MREIVITSKRVKRELYILLICFATAFILNIIAIIIYRTSWVEVFSQLGYVVVITFILYVLVTFIRFVIYLAKQLFRKRG